MTRAYYGDKEVAKEECQYHELYVPSFGRFAREKGIILDLSKNKKKER